MIANTKLYKALVFLILLLLTNQIVKTNTYFNSINQVLTIEEKLWLEKHGPIKVAPDPSYAPVEFFDKNGIYKGITAEYLKLMEIKLGLKFQVIRLNSWNEIMTSALSGKFDISTCVQNTPERQKLWNFTEPHTSVSTAIFVHKDSPDMPDITYLKDKKVGVVKGYAIIEYLRKQLPGLNLIEAIDTKAGLIELSLKKTDAMIADYPAALYAIQNMKIENLKVCGYTKYTFNYAIAVRNDLPILKNIMQKGLNAISPEEKEEIHRKWIKSNVKNNTQYRPLLVFLVLIIGIGLTLFGMVKKWSLRTK